MSQYNIDDILTVLSTRGRFLRLVLDGPIPRCDLAAEAGVSTRTANRALRDLERVGFVKRVASGYCATLCGILAAAERTAHRQRLAAVGAATPVVSALPLETPLTAAVIEDGTVRVGTPGAPDEPVRQAYDLTRDASRMKGLAPLTLSQSVEIYHDRIVNHGLELEFVCSSDVVDALTSVYTEQFDDALGSANVTVYESERTLPFRLFIAETARERWMGLAVQLSNGVHGTITNDTDEAVSWAENLYKEYRRDATPLANSIDSS